MHCLGADRDFRRLRGPQGVQVRRRLAATSATTRRSSGRARTGPDRAVPGRAGTRLRRVATSAAAPKRFKAKATKGNDNTVQKRVSGLRAGTPLQVPLVHERRAATARSAASRPRRPEPGEDDPLRDHRRPGRAPAPGRDDALLEHASRSGTGSAGEDNDFNVLMGDTIYSDSEVPGDGSPASRSTVPQKWAKYRINLGLKPWPRPRGAASYYAHWDDHEFINDFSRFENVFPLGVGERRINGETALQARRQGLPQLQPDHLLGAERDLPQLPLGQEPARSSSSTSAPSAAAAPTTAAPATTRPGAAIPTSRRPRRRAPATLFSAIVPSLATRRRRPALAKINDPNRTMLGAAPAGDRFKKAIKKLDRDLQGDLQRGPDPAVLRAALRPLGGLRGGAAEAAAGSSQTTSRTSSS